MPEVPDLLEDLEVTCALPAHGRPRVVRVTRADPPGEDRARYQWQCPSCADNLSVREENLLPILQRLREHGVRALTLGGLQAAVRMRAQRS